MEQVLVELEDRIGKVLKEVKTLKKEIEARDSERASLEEKVASLEERIRDLSGAHDKREAEFREKLSVFSAKIGGAIKQLDSVI